MSLEQLLKLNIGNPRFREVAGSLAGGSKLIQVEGLAAAAKAWMLAGIFTETRRTTLVVTYTPEQAERIAEDLPFYGVPPESVLFYPASDSLIYEESAPSYSVIGERLAALHALALEEKPAIIVAPINAALRRTLPKNTLVRSYAIVKVGEEMDMDRFAALLVSMGYEPTDVVDRYGEFSRRGGIIDVYPSNEENPVRIELWGDEIESLRHFDSATQRSVDKVESVLILPSREVLLDEETAHLAISRIRKELDSQLAKLAIRARPSQRCGFRTRSRTISPAYRAWHTSTIWNTTCVSAGRRSVDIRLLTIGCAGGYRRADAGAVALGACEEQMVETLINRAGRGLLLASGRSSMCRLNPR